jgi:DNA-binding response OmpR family regulator
MSKGRILIVDDDEHIAELIELYLKKAGYESTTAYDGEKAVDLFKVGAPDLVLLDIMLPGMDGYDVLREIRKISEIPVIMLTAKGETFDKVLGLELGADDYIIKPFDTSELIARIKAVLRRAGDIAASVNALTLPGLTVDMKRYQVNYHGKILELPPKELELLYFLASNPNQVFTRDQLLEQVWGYDFVGNSRTVDVHIKRLRERFNQNDSFTIKTVWSVGYKFTF